MDVLKMGEEALEPFAAFAAYIEAHPRSGMGDEMYGLDNSDDARLRQSDLKAARAALTALRGLEWKPIAEMERFEDDGVWVGKWGLIGWTTDYPFCSQPHAVNCGYTHFCRPILPTPPKREVEWL